MMSNGVETITQYIDGIPCKLKEPFDFSFLKEYGKVFRIFDEQESGNICFGVSNGENKYFIKFAGARTVKYSLPVLDAVARLKASVPKYKDMAHPLLIRLIEAKKIGSGYALIFDWEDGESISVENPLPHERFSSLPIDEKHTCLKKYYDFMNMWQNVVMLPLTLMITALYIISTVEK